MPPNDNIDTNSPYPIVMDEAEELPEDGFVIVSYNNASDENSENEIDADGNNSDANCQQSTEGYSLLSQNEYQQMDCSSESDDDDFSEIIDTAPRIIIDGENNSAPEKDNANMETTEIIENNEPNTLPGSSFTSSVMTEEDQDLVKKTMSSFTLPTTNIPPWANDIPEEQWLKSFTTQVLKR